MKDFIKALLGRGDGTLSFAQCGEDIIVDFVLKSIGITKPTYLDIGAHHPTHLSNTYYFYTKGNRGVCVEPDPILCEGIQQKRKGDVCLNVGVSAYDATSLPFYVMSARSLSTFSKEDAERYANYGQQKIEQMLSIDCLSINTILKQYFPRNLDYVSVDIEGKDLEILEAFDFSIQRPSVFCLETLTYTEDKSEQKITSIIDYMVGQGYMIYADTYINTVFVDRKRWEQR